jgi:hypothetical protein
VQAYERYRQLASERSQSADDRVLVNGLDHFFHVVGWDVRIGGLCTTSDLLQLFEDGFICDRLLDSVTNLLVSQIESARTATEVAIVDTNLPLVLSMDELWVSYKTERQLTALRILTDRIHTDGLERIIFPANVNDNHWAMFEINIAERMIRYGDSLGMPAPAFYVSRIQRWMRHVTTDKFVVGPPLDVPLQADSWSCAIVSFNTILRCISNVARWTSTRKDLLRLEWVLLVCFTGGAFSSSQFGLPGDWLLRTFGLTPACSSGDSDSASTTSQSCTGHFAFEDRLTPDSSSTSTPPSSDPPMPALEDICDTGDEDSGSESAWSPSDDEDDDSRDDGAEGGCGVVRSLRMLDSDEDEAPAQGAAHHGRSDDGLHLQAAVVAPDAVLRPKREYRDLRASSSTKGILAFFAKATREEVERQRQAAAELEREAMMEARAAEERNAEATRVLRLERKRQKTRERKRRERQRRKEAKATALAAAPRPVSFLSSLLVDDLCSIYVFHSRMLTTCYKPAATMAPTLLQNSRAHSVYSRRQLGRIAIREGASASTSISPRRLRTGWHLPSGLRLWSLVMQSGSA